MTGQVGLAFVFGTQLRQAVAAQHASVGQGAGGDGGGEGGVQDVLQLAERLELVDAVLFLGKPVCLLLVVKLVERCKRSKSINKNGGERGFVIWAEPGNSRPKGTCQVIGDK